MTQIRREVSFTKGRIVVRGKLVSRGKSRRADYILYYKPNVPIAIIEAKDNKHSVGDGMQQGLGYAKTLDIPFFFSSNGDGYVFHDRTGQSDPMEQNLALDAFPSPEQLWEKYRTWKGLAPADDAIVLQDYYEDGSGKEPRYYQSLAINKSIEAIAKGQNRILLVMATGTGKTFTAFQIIWRLWKAGRKKRILFLADRNVLVDQTMVNDFRPFAKYEDEGVLAIDDPKLLKVAPFSEFGLPLQLIKEFGGRKDFEQAVHEMQAALYNEIA
jgi:type I restriction enzyme R subunit